MSMLQLIFRIVCELLGLMVRSDSAMGSLITPELMRVHATDLRLDSIRIVSEVSAVPSNGFACFIFNLATAYAHLSPLVPLWDHLWVITALCSVLVFLPSGRYRNQWSSES